MRPDEQRSARKGGVTAPHNIVVLMGVMGSGKTTIGRAVAAASGVEFLEGDDLHPTSNIVKMSAGIPLDDDDRAPWLRAVADWIARQRVGGRGGVVSCSALKRAYRDTLRSVSGDNLRLVLLDQDWSVLSARLSARGDHFMPAALLSSQLATLERPHDDEHALILTGTATQDAQIQAVLDWTRQG